MQKDCKACQVQFEITDEDLAFYDKVSPVFGGVKCAIPSPKHCPDCRLQRRSAWRNERYMFKNNCSLCQKEIVTIHGPDVKFPIYCSTCWWGDKWDARDYGQDYDPSRPFFEQLKEVMDKTPQLAIQNDDGIGSQNCAYCQDFAYGKNCYFVVGTWYTEDSFYSSINASYNKNICDCMALSKVELAYECMNSQSLYNCTFLTNSENCSDCHFGFDLKGCRDCFGCINLRQKQFYIFNEPYSEEDYRKKITEFNLGSYSSQQQLKKQFREWSLKFPRKDMNLQNCENSEGNDLLNCKDSYGFSMFGSEGIKFCAQGDANKFSHDVFNAGRPQWSYEDNTTDDSYLTHFSWFTWKSKNCLYTVNCQSSENLFGCVSLHRGKFCILNKQYTEEEYNELVPRIIEHMKSTGEWGEYPSIEYSFFPYNETIGQEYFPLSKEEVLKNGWRWRDPDKKDFLEQTYVIPDNIVDVEESITQEILACLDCGKNYKIIPQELKFYKKMGIPIPRKCPHCRHLERLKLRPPYHLFERNCAKCNSNIKTPYPPNGPEIVYCEKCYLETIY